MRVWNRLEFVEIRWRSMQHSSPQGKSKPFCPCNLFRRSANICFYFQNLAISILKIWSNYFCEPLPVSFSILDTQFEMTIPSVKTPSKNFPPFPKLLRRRRGCESSFSETPLKIYSGTSHVWPLLGKFYPFYPPIFPKNKTPKVKRGLKTSCARTLGHFGQKANV